MVIWAQSEHFESTFFLLFLPLFQSLLPPVLYFARVTCPHTLYVCGSVWISKDVNSTVLIWHMKHHSLLENMPSDFPTTSKVDHC